MSIFYVKNYPNLSFSLKNINVAAPFEYVAFQAKIFLILQSPSFENSTTSIAIASINNVRFYVSLPKEVCNRTVTYQPSLTFVEKMMSYVILVNDRLCHFFCKNQTKKGRVVLKHWVCMGGGGSGGRVPSIFWRYVSNGNRNRKYIPPPPPILESI